MWVKWLGVVLVMGASFALGERQAGRLRRRQAALEEFRAGLRLLAAEIGYTATPLPKALENVAHRLRLPPVRAFFQEVCLLLVGKDINALAPEAWSAACEKFRDCLALGKDDWQAVLRAAAGLGGLGREDVLSQLELVDMELGRLAIEATEACRQGERMWRYLGALGGAAAVILLL